MSSENQSKNVSLLTSNVVPPSVQKMTYMLQNKDEYIGDNRYFKNGELYTAEAIRKIGLLAGGLKKDDTAPDEVKRTLFDNFTALVVEAVPSKEVLYVNEQIVGSKQYLGWQHN